MSETVAAPIQEREPAAQRAVLHIYTGHADVAYCGHRSLARIPVRPGHAVCETCWHFHARTGKRLKIFRG